jgi:hypothetical protein
MASSVAGRLGVATSDPCITDSELSRCPGQVLISRDGGTSWTPVLSTATAVFATAESTAGRIRLWAAEAFPGAGGYDNPHATEVKLLTSTDDGHSWNRLSQLSQRTLGGQITTSVQIYAGRHVCGTVAGERLRPRQLRDAWLQRGGPVAKQRRPHVEPGILGQELRWRLRPQRNAVVGRTRRGCMGSDRPKRRRLQSAVRPAVPA